MKRVILVVLGACSFEGTPIHDGPPGVDGNDCFGSGTFTLCVPSLPTSPIEIVSPLTIDTSSPEPCTFMVSQLFGPELCVLAGTSVTISDALVATGSRPLAILATGDAMISGVIDVSSSGMRVGAGGNDLACLPTGDGIGNPNGGGGGAGGSFGSPGGAGGAGDGGMIGGGLAAPKSDKPGIVRGGCPGGRGGIGSVPDDPPGAGGGAIYVLAGGALTLSGTIDASGAGGGGGRQSKGGGAGGGSGGMIVLWANDLRNGTPLIFANGGGGGGGADNGVNGMAGSDPKEPSIGAPGGTGGGITGPGPGGAGAFRDAPASPGSNDTTGAGGGGGGGGVGFLLVISGQALGGDLSPAPAF